MRKYGEWASPLKEETTVETKQTGISFSELENDVIKLNEKLKETKCEIEDQRQVLRRKVHTYATNLTEAFLWYAQKTPEAKDTDWNLFTNIQDIQGDEFQCDIGITLEEGCLGELRYFTPDTERRTVKISPHDAHKHFAEMAEMVLYHAMAVDVSVVPDVLYNWEEKTQVWYESTQNYFTEELRKSTREKEVLKKVLSLIPGGEE